MTGHIDLSRVPSDRAQTILERYEATMEMIVASNNTLLGRLAKCPGMTDEQIQILNEWSLFNNALYDALSGELDRLGTDGPEHTVN